MKRLLAIAVLLSTITSFAGLSASPVMAENWPFWRGPEGDGISHETDLPTDWAPATDDTPAKNIAWTLPLPGPAGSTPIVWGDRIFLTSVGGEEDDDMLLLCIGTDGKELWTRKIGSGNIQALRDEGNCASSSPSTDGEHVWAFFGNGDFACYDFDGNQIWYRDVEDEFGKLDVKFVHSTTPLLVDDRLYIQFITETGHFVVAFDKLTGKTIWKVDRESDAVAECRHSYASPQLYDDGKTRFFITHGADYTIAHDLEDGHELWRCGGLHPSTGYDKTLRFVSSPVVVPGLIVIPSAKRGPTVGVRPGGQGDITDNPDFIAWKFDTTTDVPSPLVYDGLVYICRESGILVCLDAETGEVCYEENAHRFRHRASPTLAGGNLMLAGRDGTITLVKPGRDFEIIGSIDMDQAIASSPIVSGGRIYLRTFDALWAIENQDK